MKITKFGHSCLLVEDSNTRVLIDPGEWNKLPLSLSNLDAILITHEHPDHLDLVKLKAILNNAQIPIFSNQAVSQILKDNQIESQVVTDQQVFTIKDLEIKAYQSKHALIYPGFPQADNTSFLLGKKLLVTGDTLVEINDPVEVLAVPMAGPWLTLALAVDYIKKVNPKKAFPVHDGSLKYPGPIYTVPKQILAPLKIEYLVLEEGTEVEF